MFNERLKELREELGLTQEELGKRINVSRTAVSGWEIGSSEPNILNLIKLSDIFNVSLDYLLGRTKERHNLNLKNKKDKDLIIDIIKTIEKHR